MNFTRRQFVGLAGAVTVGPAFVARVANADAWPDRVVKFIVPYPPGGSNDPAARVVGNRLSEIWGQPVIIENRAGAGGLIAAQYVTQSPPDGYTQFVAGDGLATLRFLYSSSSFDPATDLLPVIRICTFANVMVVPNSSSVKSLKEFFDFANAHKGKLTFASSGAGSSPHLCGELFKLKSGIELSHVPYRGGGPALTDLMAGRVDVMFATAPTVVGQFGATPSGRSR